MWAFLDLVARLILLGGVALVFFWVRSILSAGELLQRGCICCGASLSALELVTCSNCLGVSNA